MESVQDATITLGEAARRLGVTVDATLQLVYDGKLSAVPDRITGRLWVNNHDIERLRREQS